MKILVLGSTGQTGKCMQDLASQGAFPASWEFIWWTRKELDLSSSYEEIDHTLSSQNFDVLLNLAAYTDVNKAEKEGFFDCYAVNYISVGTLAGVCREKGAKLIHISTDYVFSGETDVAKTILSHPNPLNAYGRSKYRGEEIIKEISENYCIIRTSSVYSEYGKNFALTMMDKFSKGIPTQVVDNQFMQPTYAGNLCLAIAAVIEDNIKGIQHYTDNHYMSWYDFACIIKKYFKNENIELEAVNSFTSEVLRPQYSNLEFEQCLQQVYFSGLFKRPHNAIHKIKELKYAD